MADNSDSRESDNNSWVIAGSEALPVEDLGLEVSEEADLAKDGTQASVGESEFPAECPDPEEAKSKGPEVTLECSSEEIPSVAPGKTPEPTSSSQHAKELGGHVAEPGSTPAPQDTLLIHNAGSLREEANTTSSEESVAKELDVEGLRRRKGRDPHLVGPGASRDRSGDSEDGELLQRKWLFGFLALMGLGLLVALGVIFDTDEGPVDTLSTRLSPDNGEAHPGTDGRSGDLQCQAPFLAECSGCFQFRSFLAARSTFLEASRELTDWESNRFVGFVARQEQPALPSLESLDNAKRPHAKAALLLSEPHSDPQSLDAMGLLLDKLAKENQDIRLMQAELQAQKEELQKLLQKTEGEALEFTTQQQSLAAENSRLTEALQRETSSLLAAQAELRDLQEKLQGPGNGRPQPRPEEGPAPDRHRHKPERQEAEIRRLRSLLTSVQRDLARAFQKVPPGEGAEGLRTELSGVEQRLARALEGVEGAKPSWRESSKARRGKERAWRRRPEGPEEHGPGHPDDGSGREHKDHHPVHKASKAASDGPHRPRKHQGTKTTKNGEHQRVGRKAKKPAEPSALWEMLAKHQYRVPQGCAGVAECARQEGLAPVQKPTFLLLLQSYLAGLGWAEHYGGLVAALDGFFGSDGAFAHDRLSFVDFLDEVEDALEELAQHLGGSEEEADNFEEVVLRQLGATPGGRFAHRGSGQQHPKERSREGHGHKNGKEGLSRAHG
ncbi:pre-B-cell leukemia transcription factor-interacting protein 1 [Elgaria multicarinata webbii]|uniref:pre-B-cell leukemia transcription factor-interacting protein 1 n=1 Tax=Elgaria multicarinata webbii TaxID=159646 RepID=UPI002FCD0175